MIKKTKKETKNRITYFIISGIIMTPLVLLVERKVFFAAMAEYPDVNKMFLSVAAPGIATAMFIITVVVIILIEIGRKNP